MKRIAFIIEFVLTATIISSILFIGNNFFFRIDITADKKYSLSEYTRKMLEELDDYLTIRLYLGDKLPPELKTLKDEIKYLLEEFKAYGGKYFNYEFIDPEAVATSREQLRVLFDNLTRKGLTINYFPYEEGGEKRQLLVVTGGFIEYGGNEVPVEFLKGASATDPFEGLTRSISQIEYELISGFLKVKRGIRPVVALLRDKCALPQPRRLSFSKLISSIYGYQEVSLKELNSLPNITVLFITGPDSTFTEEEVFIIDQFVMRGGNLVLCINGVSASMDSLAHNNTMVVFPFSHGLESFLMNAGIVVSPRIVMDLNCSPVPIISGMVAGAPVYDYVPWVFFPICLPQENEPVVKNIDPVLLRFPSRLEITRVKDLNYRILLTTGRNSRTVQTPYVVNLNILRKKPDFSLFNEKTIPVAILVEGNFQSSFAQYRNFYSFAANMKEKTVKPVKIAVVSDAEVFSNQTRGNPPQPLPVGYDKYTGKLWGNGQFLMSLLHYMCGDTALLILKNKEIRVKPLNTQIVRQHRTIIQAIAMSSPLLFAILLYVVFYLLRKKYNS